jgi:hypothetical protein
MQSFENLNRPGGQAEGFSETALIWSLVTGAALTPSVSVLDLSVHPVGPAERSLGQVMQDVPIENEF